MTVQLPLNPTIRDLPPYPFAHLDELRKIGLELINVNVTDIQDESGYIEALGKEAAAKAINDAKQSVAEKDRDGSIGEARANMDMRIQVSSADADAKVLHSLDASLAGHRLPGRVDHGQRSRGPVRVAQGDAVHRRERIAKPH